MNENPVENWSLLDIHSDTFDNMNALIFSHIEACLINVSEQATQIFTCGTLLSDAMQKIDQEWF